MGDAANAARATAVEPVPVSPLRDGIPIARHTATPWSHSSLKPEFIERDGQSVWIYGTMGCNSPRVARVQFGAHLGQQITEETAANAAFIVRSVNSHDALRSACAQVVAALSGRVHSRDALAAIAACEAALEGTAS